MNGVNDMFVNPTKEEFEKMMTEDAKKILHFIENLRNPNVSGVHHFQEMFLACLMADHQKNLGSPLFAMTFRLFENHFPVSETSDKNPRTWNGKVEE